MVNNVMEIGSKLKGKVDKNRVTAALEHIWLSKVFLKKKKKRKERACRPVQATL